MLDNSTSKSNCKIDENSFYSENNYIHHEESGLNNVFINSFYHNNQDVSQDKNELNQTLITAENIMGISLEELKENLDNYTFEELLEKITYLIEYTYEVVKLSEICKSENDKCKNRYNDLNSKYKETLFMLMNSEKSNKIKDNQMKEMLKQIESLNEKNICLINAINENKQEEIETRNDTYKFMTTEETDKISLNQSKIIKDKIINTTINTEKDKTCLNENGEFNKKSILKKKNKQRRNKSIMTSIKIKASRGKSQTLLSYNNIVKSENMNNIESIINCNENISKTASKCNQFKIELTNELSFKKRNFNLKENSDNFIDYFGTDEKPKTTKNKKDFLLDFSRCSITLDQVSEFPELNNNIGINEYVPLPTAKFQNILKEDCSNNDYNNINLDNICCDNIFESFKNPSLNIQSFKKDDQKHKKLEKRYTLKQFNLLSLETDGKSNGKNSIQTNKYEKDIIHDINSNKIKNLIDKNEVLSDSCKETNFTNLNSITKAEEFEFISNSKARKLFPNEICNIIKLSFSSNFLINKNNHDYLKEAKNVYMKYFKKTNVIDKKTLL